MQTANSATALMAKILATPGKASKQNQGNGKVQKLVFFVPGKQIPMMLGLLNLIGLGLKKFNNKLWHSPGV